ncbi:hypothetical protein ACJX0J_020569, partial [Zea mays]
AYNYFLHVTILFYSLIDFQVFVFLLGTLSYHFLERETTSLIILFPLLCTFITEKRGKYNHFVFNQGHSRMVITDLLFSSSATGSMYGIIDIDKTRFVSGNDDVLTTRTLMMDMNWLTTIILIKIKFDVDDFSGKAIIVAHGRTTHTNNRRLHVIEIHFFTSRSLCGKASPNFDQYILFFSIKFILAYDKSKNTIDPNHLL